MFVKKNVPYWNRSVLVLIFIFISSSLNASWLSDGWNGLKSVANTVGDQFKKLGDCFGDTKVTRAVDYGVRKAALESALPIATAALDAAKGLSDASLIAAEETAKAAVQAAKGVLDGVKGVSEVAMKGAAKTSQGILEGVKIGTVGVLQGARLATGALLDQFDINEIGFKGDLRRISDGVLGDVRVKGKFFVSFNEQLTIDPKNIAKSIANLVDKLVKELGNKVFDPISSAIDKADAELNKPAVQQGLVALDMTEPKVLADLFARQKDIQDRLAEINLQEEKMRKILKQAQDDINHLRSLSDVDLLAEVKKANPRGYSAFEIRARQVLAQRQQAERNMTEEEKGKKRMIDIGLKMIEDQKKK